MACAGGSAAPSSFRSGIRDGKSAPRSVATAETRQSNLVCQDRLTFASVSPTRLSRPAYADARRGPPRLSKAIRADDEAFRQTGPASELLRLAIEELNH
jgi:hypothetical protein